MQTSSLFTSLATGFKLAATVKQIQVVVRAELEPGTAGLRGPMRWLLGRAAGYSWIRNFFFPDKASVHKHPANSAAYQDVFQSAL